MKVLSVISFFVLLPFAQSAVAQNYSGNLLANSTIVMDSIRMKDSNFQHPPEGVMSVFVIDGIVLKKGMNGVMDTYAEAPSETKQPSLQNDLIPALESSVLFGINQFSLSNEAIAALQKYLTVLKSPGVKSIYISGYTDISGSLKYNRLLSNRRAESVKNWLVQQGVASNIIITIGKGPLEAEATVLPASQRKAVIHVIIK